MKMITMIMVVRFNGIELQLTKNDIEYLEEAIKNQELPETSFFFGSDSYTWNEEGYAQDDIQENYYYKENDLQFIESAKEALKKNIGFTIIVVGNYRIIY